MQRLIAQSFMIKPSQIHALRLTIPKLSPIRSFSNYSKGVVKGDRNKKIQVEQYILPDNNLTKNVNPLTKDVSVSTLQQVHSDIGLTQFIRTTYWYTAGSLITTVSGAHLLSMTSLGLSSPMAMLGGGFVLAMGGAIGLGLTKYSVHQKEIIARLPDGRKKIADYWYSKNSPARILSGTSLITGMTLTMTPFIAMMNTISPTILTSSLLATSCVFGGSIAYAYMKPKGALLALEAPLMGGLVGLVGMGLVGLGSQLIFGPTLFSQALHTIDTYAGILLFTALSAYDTHKSIEMYENKDPDHLGCAINLYLDFINLLIRIMEVMAKIKKD